MKSLLIIHADDNDGLPGVSKEIRAVMDAYQNPETPAFEGRVTSSEDIETRLRKTGGTTIFHFAGHAIGNCLVTGELRGVKMDYFSTTLTGYGGRIKLVFLNACATEQMASSLRKNGVETVIATTEPVKDKFAFRFAANFYKIFAIDGKTVSEALKLAHAATISDVDLKNTEKSQILDAQTNEINPEFLDEDRQKAWDGDWEQERGRNFKRPAIKYDENNIEIYRAYGKTDVRFSDWESGGTPATTVSHDGQLPPDEGLNKALFLLCDRDQQTKLLFQKVQNILSDCSIEALEKKWRTKQYVLAEQQLKPILAPLFVFLNSSSQQSPLWFLQRFEDFILKLHWPKKVEKIIDFEKLEDVISLDALIDDNGVNHQLNVLTSKYSAEIPILSDGSGSGLYVIKHQLPRNGWEDNCNLKNLLIKLIQQESCAYKIRKLIFIFWVQHDADEVMQKYGTLFSELEHCLPEKDKVRIAHIQKLPNVSAQDVEDWYQAVFSDDFDPENYKIAPTQTFKKVKPILDQILEDQHIKKAKNASA